MEGDPFWITKSKIFYQWETLAQLNSQSDGSKLLTNSWKQKITEIWNTDTGEAIFSIKAQAVGTQLGALMKKAYLWVGTQLKWPQ